MLQTRRDGAAQPALLIDSHCHIDAAAFDADRDQVIAAARAAGVAMLVTPAVRLDNFAAIAALCRRHQCCAPAWGVHPLYVGRSTPQDLQQLRQWLQQQRPVAVGEIGLDRYVEHRDDNAQMAFFTAQLRLAREFDLPVLLHVRRAVDAVLQQLRRFGVRRGVAHAFNGSLQQAEAFIKQGFKLGFGGACTHPGASKLRSLAAQLPLQALVLETDAPDMAPAWRRHQRNDPAQLPRIAQTLAQLRRTSPQEIAAAAFANTLAALPALAALQQQTSPANDAV